MGQLYQRGRMIYYVNGRPERESTGVEKGRSRLPRMRRAATLSP